MNESILEGAFTVIPRRNADGIFYTPYEYTGVDREILAHKVTAHISTNLHFSTPIYDVKGPDAIRFMNSICINTFNNVAEDGMRHAVICNEQGKIMTDGVVIRIGENHFRTYWLNPVIQYLLEKSDMDVVGEVKDGTEFFYQIAGPKSLEILEDAFQCDLHDIKFARHKLVKICGTDVRIIRLGMTGGLAYELHGDRAYTDLVYERIWTAGKKYGLAKCGSKTYTMVHHTEGGYPNINLHYPMPWYEDPDFAAYLNAHPGLGGPNEKRCLLGSVGDDLESRFVTPYDVGWGFLIRFNHEFTGREALKKLENAPHRSVVTLEWDPDDIGKVFTSQFRGEDVEPFERIDDDSDFVSNRNRFDGTSLYRADKIFANGSWIGNSVGRINSYHFHRMISLGFIEEKYAVEGTEVEILWGTPGKPQIPIRAKVARFPYNNIDRNETFDVEQIPHFSVM